MDELGPLSLEDLNQNIKIIRNQLLTEIRETQNAVQAVQNRDLGISQDVFTRIEELEKQNKEGVMIKRFKRELDDVYENIEKLKSAIQVNQGDGRLQDPMAQRNMQEKLNSLETEVFNLKKTGPPPRREFGNTTGNPMYNSGSMSSTKPNESIYHLALLEMAVKPPLEDKIAAIQEKLFRSDVYLNEKFYAFLTLLYHYRFVNNKFFIQAYESFKSLIPSSSKNQIVIELKRDNYPNASILLSNQYDCYFPNFSIVLQTLNHLLTEGKSNTFIIFSRVG